MAKVKVEAWQCEFPKCGHIWMAEKEPARCSKCKRKNWNKTGKKKRGKKVAKPKTLTTSVNKVVVEVTDTVPLSGGIYDPDNPYPVGVSTAPGWEKPYELPVVSSANFPGETLSIDMHQKPKPLPLPAQPEPNPNDPVTVVAKPSADRLRELLKKMAAPEQKIGQKCPHGWSNWMQCPKCNKKEDR